jgi:hypothetical protein
MVTTAMATATVTAMAAVEERARPTVVEEMAAVEERARPTVVVVGRRRFTPWIVGGRTINS